MKNYNFLTKKEIDEMIAEYEEDQRILLKGCFSITTLINATLNVKKAKCWKTRDKGLQN